MLVLFETPAGYALFKILDQTILASVDEIWKSFSTIERAHQVVKLKAFSKFEDTTAALAAVTAIYDGKLDKSLKLFLREAILQGREADEKVILAVGDAKLGGLIQAKLNIRCVYDNTILELMRGIRSQSESLVSGQLMKLEPTHDLD